MKMIKYLHYKTGLIMTRNVSFNLFSHFTEIVYLHTKFQVHLISHEMKELSLGDSSVTVLLCLCVGGFICGVCFVISLFVPHLSFFWCSGRLCFAIVAFSLYLHLYL